MSKTLKPQMCMAKVSLSSDHFKELSLKLYYFWAETVVSMSLHLHKHS